jgi:hypothetical protein
MEVVMRVLTDAELDVVAAAGERKKKPAVKVVIVGNKVWNSIGDNTGLAQQGLINFNSGNVSYTGNITYGATAPV